MGGIVIQKVKPGFDVSKKDQTLPIYNRAQHASWKLICLRHWLLSTSTVNLDMNFPRELCSLHPLYIAKFTQSASKSIKSDRLHRWWGVAKRRNLYQGLVALSQLLVSRPLKSQPLTISLPSNQPFTEVSVVEVIRGCHHGGLSGVCAEFFWSSWMYDGPSPDLEIFWGDYKKHVIIPGPFQTGTKASWQVINARLGTQRSPWKYSQILAESDRTNTCHTVLFCSVRWRPPFHKCNGDMTDLFFAYDGPNYLR